MPHINWKSVSYIINYYLTQWTDNRMPDKRGTDNRGSTVCKALRNPLRHSFSLNFFERLRKAVRVKKRHIFLANLKGILKHSLSVREIFLVYKFNGEMLKTSDSCEFLLKINQIVVMFAIRLLKKSELH